MIYREFLGKKLSLLGFGTMRLPVDAQGNIDEAETEAMTAYALSHGINYIDTAHPYHRGKSELVMGRILSQYPRESFYLADKYPGHIHELEHDPAGIFEGQLRKCRVDYFDFYLLHNVYENSMDTYLDPKLGIIDYFREQKKLGRIKHLGFSSHGSVENLRQFLDICGDDMEFCQIQLNWLDWTLQQAKEKYELLTERGIPVIVMEPVRGGKLGQLSESAAAKLADIAPGRTAFDLSFRFLQSLPNVAVVLSGMSAMAHMEENVATFDKAEPLTEEETKALLDIAEEMKDCVPCTGCRYCCDGCPAGLDIPNLLTTYNDIKVIPHYVTAMHVEMLPEEKKPSACIGCGKCSQICPQHIDVPEALADLIKRMEAIPSWVEMSRARNAAEKDL